MAKYKALIEFDGKKEKKRFAKGEEIEMTVKRAEEIERNIKKDYGIEQTLERIDVAE